MATVAIQGLAPFLPGHRPRSPARWWTASAPAGLPPRARTVSIEALEEGPDPPEVSGVAGLAAPCSLPEPFLASLALPPERAAQLRALASRTANRLLREARSFAARRTRGQRHPRRGPGESASALDRARLPLFHAALPLLARHRTCPWDAAEPPFLVEVDPPSLLAALGLPSSSLGGERADAIERRAAALEALARSGPGFRVVVGPRDLAIASEPALRAVVAAAAAAWFVRNRPSPPPPPASCWIPLP